MTPAKPETVESMLERQENESHAFAAKKDLTQDDWATFRYAHTHELTALAQSWQQRAEAATEALRELVACKDLKESCGNFKWAEPDSNKDWWRRRDDYDRRQPLAWSAARAFLSDKVTK